MSKGSSKKLGSKSNPMNSQGVRDLNGLGPKRIGPPVTPSKGESALSEGTIYDVSGAFPHCMMTGERNRG